LQQELIAESEAAKGVFEARLRAATDQGLAAAKKAVEQTADACAAELERTFQTARHEHQALMNRFMLDCEQNMRDHHERLAEFPVATLGNLNEQVQQISRLAVERVREAHEMLLREMPRLVGEAEKDFRDGLDKIVEQARGDISTLLQGLSAQLMAQAEMEMRRRFYAAAQGEQ
jgi:acyl-CoA reductase-like NAD-dependent aldehyde dehydrogenase